MDNQTTLKNYLYKYFQKTNIDPIVFMLSFASELYEAKISDDVQTAIDIDTNQEIKSKTV
jgi:hypothetical protein